MGVIGYIAGFKGAYDDSVEVSNRRRPPTIVETQVGHFQSVIVREAKRRVAVTKENFADIQSQ